MRREAGGVYELCVEVAIEREVGERACHRLFVAQARANVSFDTAAKLVLAGNQGGDPDLGAAPLDRQPPEYLVDGGALIVIPVMAWWFGITLLEALATEISILAFLLLFTFAFNWLFDRIAGLPDSAR